MHKRSLSISGHRTSLALEPEFWEGLEAIAGALGLSLPATVEAIDSCRTGSNLSSAVRIAVLAWYRDEQLPFQESPCAAEPDRQLIGKIAPGNR